MSKKPAAPASVNQKYELVAVDKIQPHPRNVNQGDIGAIIDSIDHNGFIGAAIVQRSTGYIMAGKHRWLAAKQQGFSKLPVIYADVDDATALRYMLADNQTSRLGTDDPEALSKLLEEILAEQGSLSGTGFDEDALQELLDDIGSGSPSQDKSEAAKKLSERFGVPPFSVLDARQGYWQERKRAWLALGIQSELGRGGAPGGSPRPAAQLTDNGTTRRGDGIGRPL